MTWSGAGERARRNKAVGIKDRAKSRVHRSREHNDMMAGAAEDTFRRQQGLPRSHQVRQPDRGWDDVLKDGRTSDTKWTEYEDGALICDPRSASCADVYILVVGSDPNDLLVRGWLPASELKRPENVRLLSPKADRTPCWVVPQTELRAMEDLYGGDDLAGGGVPAPAAHPGEGAVPVDREPRVVYVSPRVREDHGDLLSLWEVPDGGDGPDAGRRP